MHRLSYIGSEIMKKRKSLKSLSVFTSLLLMLCTLINILAPLSTIAEGGLGTLSGPSINVDANKSDWADVQPSGESLGRGFSDFGIGNLYLTNDEDNLYFWIDADNVADDWDKEGESEGMYIDLAFQINSKNSENISNPWGYQFNYSGMDAKPQFHLSLRVVYNHTYATEGSVFNNIVPGYYFRTNDLGHYTNGSGTGNEVASERPMVRKYIKDSVRFWAEEYNVDGFRFDLMGLIDTDTMLAVEQELHTKVDPNIIIYGEPWQAGGSPLLDLF